MFRKQTLTVTPDLIPVLSRGRHRNPRKGGCFMELASCLAGERWSDHPHCTHPLLASLARLVNDYTSDAGRARLIELVPSVIGLTSEDVHVDAAIALRCARTALPLVRSDRQDVMAVGILTTERLLADLDGDQPDRISAASREALDQVPHAARWAARFSRRSAPTPRNFRRFSAPTAVACAVPGLVEAGLPDSDETLRKLLVEAISDCTALCAPVAPGTASADSRAGGGPLEMSRPA